jgi:hypothetical protein
VKYIVLTVVNLFFESDLFELAFDVVFGQFFEVEAEKRWFHVD